MPSLSSSNFTLHNLRLASVEWEGSGGDGDDWFGCSPTSTSSVVIAAPLVGSTPDESERRQRGVYKRPSTRSRPLESFHTKRTQLADRRPRCTHCDVPPITRHSRIQIPRSHINIIHLATSRTPTLYDRLLELTRIISPSIKSRLHRH